MSHLLTSAQVVLASGEIVNATQDSHEDLWLGLKGGSNNFGIVTAFDLEAFEQGDFWGGFIGYGPDTFDQQYVAFEALNAGEYDPYAAIIANFVWNNTARSWFGANNFEYTKPEANPPAFENFTRLPSTFSTMRISNLTDFTVELAATNPAGRRLLMSTSTFQNSAAMMSKVIQIANETVRDLTSVSGLDYSLSFQPLPEILLERAEQAGGNSLGLDPSNGPLVNFLLGVGWEDAADDALVNEKAKELDIRSKAAAEELGKSHEYLYLNYAADWQDPIAGYGADVVARLQRTSEKYDPNGVFQKQVPGGFKLS